MFSLDDLEKFINGEDKKPTPKEYAMYTGLYGRLMMDWAVRREGVSDSIIWFPSSVETSFGYIEYTPHNKGNLWKVRYYGNNTFRVFYGTKQMAYCTSLKECIVFMADKPTNILPVYRFYGRSRPSRRRKYRLTTENAYDSKPFLDLVTGREMQASRQVAEGCVAIVRGVALVCERDWYKILFTLMLHGRSARTMDNIVWLCCLHAEAKIHKLIDNM